VLRDINGLILLVMQHAELSFGIMYSIQQLQIF